MHSSSEYLMRKHYVSGTVVNGNTDLNKKFSVPSLNLRGKRRGKDHEKLCKVVPCVFK
jgi:hypothetical protein